MPEHTPDPIRDSLRALADHGGAPMTPLPPSEVRRLGDRRRARRTAATAVASVAVIAAVATPIALLGGGNEDRRPPVTSPSGLTKIPDDFPLDRNAFIWPYEGEGEVRGPAADVRVEPVTPCGTDVLGSPQAVDRLGFVSTGPEVHDTRELLLLKDDRAAQAALAAARRAIDDCPTELRNGVEHTWTTRPTDTGHDSVTISEAEPTGLGGRTVQYTRVGRAILIVDVGGEGGGDAASQTAVTKVVAPAMCLFTAEGCAPSSGIPDGFPLDLGAYDFGAGGERRGPAADVQVEQPTPCDATPLESRPVADRLAFTNIGDEFQDHRQLVLYDNELDAEAVLADLARAVAACPTETSDGMTLTWQTTPVDLGVPSVTAVQGVKGSNGGRTFQLARVGRAILQVAWLGEGGGDVAGQSGLSRQITSEMCAWSSDGCRAKTGEGSSDTQGSTGAAVGEIADDFPLGAGFPSESERGSDGYAGPNRTIDPIVIEACGARLPDPAYRDRLLATYESAEDGRARQLTTYADAAAAIAASRDFVEAFRACPVDPAPDADGYTSERTVQDLDLGGESWALLDRVTMNGSNTPFGSTLLVVRVGRAVLIENQGGHAGYPDPSGIADLSERLAAPIAAMCVFTVAGC